MIDDLAGLGVELADELGAEVGVPGVPVGIDDHVVRQRLFAWQVVFGDDHIGGLALRTREGFEIVFHAVRIGEADLLQILGRLIHHVGGNARTLAAQAALHDELRTRRHAFGRIAAHAGKDLLPLGGVMHGGEYALERVAALAVEQERGLEPILARDAGEPLAVRELRGDIAHLVELDVGGGACGGHLDALRARQRVAGGADGDIVFAWIELAGREAELALVVRHYRGGDGRAFLLGADEHAFHHAFRLRGNLAAERLCLSGGRHQCEAGGGKQERFQSHGRLP